MRKLNRESQNERKSNKFKLIISIFLIIASIVYGLTTLKKFKQGLPPEKKQVSVQSDNSLTEYLQPSGIMEEIGPPSSAEIKKMRKKVIKELNLTKKQQIQLLKLRPISFPGTPEEMTKFIEELGKVLTPEQQDKLVTIIEERMSLRIMEHQEDALRTLPPDQYKIFEERLRNRMKRMEKVRAKGLDGMENKNEESGIQNNP